MENKSNVIVKIILLVGVAIALTSLVIMLTMTPTPKMKANQHKGIAIENHDPNTGGDFVLTDSDGKVFDSRDLRGKFLLIYFGFTYCPDICPASLYEMKQALDELKSDQVQAIFITIDPKRDSQDQLNRYFKDFDRRIIPLTGTDSQISEVAKKYKVYYAKSQDEKENTENYLINHSSFFYLVDSEGRLIKYYPSSVNGSYMAKDIAKYLK